MPYYTESGGFRSVANGIPWHKRTMDVLMGLGLLILLAPFLAAVALLIRVDSPGPAIYWSQRVGRRNQLFPMPKFRTMHVGAPQVATHLLVRPDAHLTRLGSFLRRTSIDELPQLWSIVRGDLSLVGPRPALFNQADLIAARTNVGVHELVPGLTGWAQINGRDEIAIPEKVALDHDYLRRASLGFDLKILMLSFLKVVRGSGVTH